MVRAAILAAIAAVLIVVTPSLAGAQCVTFSSAAQCPRKTPPSVLQGAAIAKAPAVVAADRSATPPQSSGLDCRMVKPIDPQFYSAMPIVKPDPKVALSGRVIAVPACRP